MSINDTALKATCDAIVAEQAARLAFNLQMDMQADDFMAEVTAAARAGDHDAIGAATIKFLSQPLPFDESRDGERLHAMLGEQVTPAPSSDFIFIAYKGDAPTFIGPVRDRAMKLDFTPPADGLSNRERMRRQGR